MKETFCAENDFKKRSNRDYINKLLTLELTSLLITLTSGVLQSIANGTNEWFVLNVNEYIPTSKGGLWSYCYISSTGYIGQYSCFRYEDLPNFGIFINNRLYEARVILICSCGFSLILNLVEVIGVICLFNAERFDLIEHLMGKKTSSKCSKPDPAMFGLKKNDMNHIRPKGYFAYLTIGTIGMLITFMDLILKITGFVLFDAYISHLLSYNTVFLAYRSYSYWLMLVTILLMVFYWLYKASTIYYVIKVSKFILNGRENFKKVKNFPTSKFIIDCLFLLHD